MKDQKRKSLDEFSDQSEQFERQFERVFAGEVDESARAQLIAEITAWLQDGARQGRFIPLTSADRRAFRSVLERWNSRVRQQGLYVEGIDYLADFDPNAGIVLTGDCPYPGLDPYTQRLRGGFFGREALVSGCVAHLEQQGNRILLIIGASGSGKSSLALAGILPRLGELHARGWIFAPPLTPGAHPVSALAASVAQAIRQPDRAIEIERGFGDKPGEALRQLAELCDGTTFMLLIDQFEELLTLCSDAGEQSALAQILCSLSDPAASTGSFSCRILLTLRTDHLARFESSNVLKPLHVRLIGENNEQYLSAIGFNDIKRAIKEPAERVGLRFIPAALIDQLASQTAGLANGLPLLQFALLRLWDTRPKNESNEPLDLISEEMVKALPDVERALGTVAEGLFRIFSPPQQRICERLLLELVVLDESFEEPLRRRRNEAELKSVLQERLPSAASDVNRVVDDFVAAGLLRRFGDGSDRELEVAHEALLRHWDRIYELVSGAAVKERLLLIKQMGREASEWVGRGRTDGYLSLRGERLDRALACVNEGWLAEPTSREYVDACARRQAAERLIEQRAKGAERFRRYTWAAATAGLVLLLGFLFWAYRSASEESFAQKLAMNAEDQLEHDSQQALLLAIEAARHGQTRGGGLTPDVERALRSAIRASSVRALINSYGRTMFLAAAYKPDGSVLALGDSLGGVTLWDVSTGLQRKALFGHVDGVQAIAFSPDRRTMASGGEDGKIVVWDTESATARWVLTGHLGKVAGVTFSRPDGRLLATAGDDGSVRLWDVSAGKEVETLYGHIGGVKTLAFGRDERQLVTAGDDNRIVIWDVLIGHARALYSFPAIRNLFAFDISADGSLLAIAAGSEVQIWNTATRGRRWTLSGHTNSVLDVRFSRDGRQVATASFDSTVRVWRLPRDEGDPQQQPNEVARFRQKGTIQFTALAFSPAGDTVAASTIERGPDRSHPLQGAATIWSIYRGEELRALAAYESAVDAVAFSPNGKTIVAVGTSNAAVQAWDVSGRRVETPFKSPQMGSMKAVAFSTNGAVAIGTGTDVLVSWPDGTNPRRLKRHKDVVNDVTFSPDGSRLVSASEDGTAVVWDVSSGKPLGMVPEKPAGALFAVAYSPDGQTIATAGRDSIITLWKADTQELLRELKGHLLGVLDVAFTTDSRKLVSGSKDKTVGIWDVTTGAEEDVLIGHGDVVYAVAISGNHLATAADDGIRLWDLAKAAPVAVFPARGQGAQSLAFSSDGHYLAAGGSDGVVRVYEMQPQQLMQLAEGRVRRGWTIEECRQFVPGKTCPRSRYSMIDEANLRFANADVKEGERLLRQANGGGAAHGDLIDAEIDARLGTAFLWAASDAINHPELWADAVKGKNGAQVAADFLGAAAKKSTNLVFDPVSRLKELLAYGDVRRARDLAARGKLEESVGALVAAHNAEWKVPGDPRSVASRLVALAVLSRANHALEGRPSKDEIENHTRDLEHAMQLYPELGPGHRLLAQLYERQKDFEGVELQYLKAASKENSGEPLAMLALSMVDRDPRKAAGYANQALARDLASDVALVALGVAENSSKNYRGAALAFDRVPSSSSSFVIALTYAAAIYFEYLDDDAAAFQRFNRAVDLAPGDLTVLSDYAEFLLASGRKDQAKLAAARAVELEEAKHDDEAYVRAAMSFVRFSVEVLSGERNAALMELDEIERHVKAAAGQDGQWSYKGIRRSLTRMSAVSSDQLQVLLKVLDFVESNGRQRTLNDVRRLLATLGV